LTIEEYEDFQTWKTNSKSNNTYIAIRKALNIAMTIGEDL
jgi:hypothetical protein